MLNIENIELKPYYGMEIKSYVDNYINSARKISSKHKFKPDIFTVRTKNFNLRDDDRFKTDELIYYSDYDDYNDFDNYTSEDDGLISEAVMSDTSDDEDEFILVE